MYSLAEQRTSIASKIEELRKSLAYSDLEDRAVTANAIRRLEHKLNEINGVKNECSLDEGDVCLSCGA